jgi:hypothetical protein
MDLLRRVGMLKCTPAFTPMTVVDKLSANEDTLLSVDDATRYHTVVGTVKVTHTYLSRFIILLSTKSLNTFMLLAILIGQLISAFFGLSSSLCGMV